MISEQIISLYISDYRNVQRQYNKFLEWITSSGLFLTLRKGIFMIKLYSTGCPRCKVLVKKLEMAGKEFEVIDDIMEVTKFAEDRGFHEAPLMVLDDGKILDFMEANRWISAN